METWGLFGKKKNKLTKCIVSNFSVNGQQQGSKDILLHSTSVHFAPVLSFSLLTCLPSHFFHFDFFPFSLFFFDTVPQVIHTSLHLTNVFLCQISSHASNIICDTYSNIMQLSTASLIAFIGMLAVTLTTVNAQGDPSCIQKCDEEFSAPLGDCILAHPKKPKHPERKQCVGDAYYEWVDCLENCYD